MRPRRRLHPGRRDMTPGRARATRLAGRAARAGSAAEPGRPRRHGPAPGGCRAIGRACSPPGPATAISGGSQPSGPAARTRYRYPSARSSATAVVLSGHRSVTMADPGPSGGRCHPAGPLPWPWPPREPPTSSPLMAAHRPPGGRPGSATCDRTQNMRSPSSKAHRASRPVGAAMPAGHSAKEHPRFPPAM